MLSVYSRVNKYGPEYLCFKLALIGFSSRGTSFISRKESPTARTTVEERLFQGRVRDSLAVLPVILGQAESRAARATPNEGTVQPSRHHPDLVAGRLFGRSEVCTLPCDPDHSRFLDL